MQSPDEHKFLWEEYRHLQDRIDRIGDFKFRVRGWLITLLAALGAVVWKGGEAQQWPLLWVGLPTTAVFFILEWQQQRYQEAYLQRTRAIEDVLRVKRAPLFVARAPPTPSSRPGKWRLRAWRWLGRRGPPRRDPRSAYEAHLDQLARWPRPLRWILKKDHVAWVFYGAQVLLLFSLNWKLQTTPPTPPAQAENRVQPMAQLGDGGVPHQWAGAGAGPDPEAGPPVDAGARADGGVRMGPPDGGSDAG